MYIINGKIVSYEKAGEIYPDKKSEFYNIRGDYSIYSVRSLKGIKFKIGDETKYGKISGIRIIFNEIVIDFEKTNGYYLDNELSNTIEFITYDNKNVFNNEIIWCCDDKVKRVFKHQVSKTSIYFLEENSHIKAFYYKKNAKDYLLNITKHIGCL